MFPFRSLTIGLLGACVMLLVRGGSVTHVSVMRPTLTAAPAPVGPTIVDVAPGVRVAEVSSLVRLAPGERVIAVDDRAVASDLAAGAAISTREPGRGGFVDLEVERADGLRRRVLVLLH